MIFYYSGCGNSRFVAKQLAESLGETLEFIPDLQRQGFCEYTFREGESLGFVFPVYSWAAPKLVEDFVSQVKWDGVPSHVWFACTCGDEAGMTAKLFAKTLVSAGLHLDAAFCFQMPETYLCMPGFKLDTPEGAEKKISAVRAKLPSVADSIKRREKVTDMIVGTFPRFKSYVIRPGFVSNVSDKKYHVLDSCVGCGICESVCPLHNVKLVDGHPTWNGNCTQCMACYNYCPQNAIHFASYTKGKGQYHFPE